MSIHSFLNSVLDKKREAEAYGWKLDVMVMPADQKDKLYQALATDKTASDSFKIVRDAIYIYGVKIMWSQSRLPTGQCWLRYRGQRSYTQVDKKHG